MKRILSLALLLTLSASITMLYADGKKGKKKVAAATTEVALPSTTDDNPAIIVSDNDSLSYAAGMYATNGMMDFLKQKYHFDEAYKAAFIEALKEFMKDSDKPAFVARVAGYNVGELIKANMIPGLTKEMEGTSAHLNIDAFQHGFLAALTGDTTIFNVKDASEYTQDHLKELKAERDEKYKSENEAWIAENAKKEGVITLPSGLQYKEITKGAGAVAGENDKVTVKYEGKLIDGTVFDSSYQRNPQTSTFSPRQVIKGWTEALTMMPEGSKWELYIPQNLAYGNRQAGKIPPYSALIFNVEVVKVEKAGN